MFLMAHLTPLAIAVEFELDLHAISPAITRHHTFVVYKSGSYLSIEFTTFEFSTPCLRCLYPRSMFTIGFYQQTMTFSTEFNLCLFVVCCQMNEITYMSNQQVAYFSRTASFSQTGKSLCIHRVSGRQEFSGSDELADLGARPGHQINGQLVLIRTIKHFLVDICGHFKAERT